MAFDTVGSDFTSIAVINFTIAASGTLSNTLWQDGLHLVGIQVPSGWTAAGLTFLGSADGVTYQSVFDNNNTEVVVAAAAGHYHAIPPTLLSRVLGLQVRSGTSATPVTQTNAVTLQLVFARYN